jgi:hypothetical protein
VTYFYILSHHNIHSIAANSTFLSHHYITSRKITVPSVIITPINTDNMPSTTNALLSRLSSKVSKLSGLRNRLTQKFKKRPADELPITHSSQGFHHERGRKLTRDETGVLFAQAQKDLEVAHALAAESITPNSSKEKIWCWEESDQKDSSGFATEKTPDTDLSGEGTEGEEDWREAWEPIKMQLKQVAKHKPVVTMPCGGLCDYDLWAALEALKEPNPEEEDGYEDIRNIESMIARFERLTRNMFGGSSEGAIYYEEEEEEEEEEEVFLEYTRDMGSMRTKDGEVAGGDVWWN